MLKYLKKIFKIIGPGFITGAADDGPSGVATYSQTGARFGFSQLWLTIFSFPFMVVIQQMCGRIGMVTGKGLASVIRTHYSRWILYFAVSLLLISNTINIGADLGVMATSTEMLMGLPFIFWLCLLTGLIITLEVFVTYKTYSKYLKYLTLSLFSYVIAAFILKPNWGIIINHTLIPHINFSKNYILNIVAILGTTISPYLFFWQASQEVEEEVSDGKITDIGVGKARVTQEIVAAMNLDTIVGIIFSQGIMFFIIITTAVTLHVNGLTIIENASQAAEALKPVAGDFAYLLFSVGIIGTGFLAIPVLAGSSAYAVAETIGIKEGLSKKSGRAPGFYMVIAASTLIGMLINWIGIDPFNALYYSAALNGLSAAPLMILVILTANNKKIMGRFVNKKFSNIIGWIVVFIMSIAGLLLIFDLAKSLLVK